MLDVIAIIIYFLISLIYFGYHVYNGRIITRENTIVGIFAVIPVAWCYYNANKYGFISLQNEILVQIPYFILMYAGTESTFKALRACGKYNADCKDLHFRFIISTVLTLWVNLITIIIGYETGIMWIFMLSNVLTPIYLIYMWGQNIIFLQKNGVFKARYTLTNYYTVAASISLYEFYDYAIAVQNPLKIGQYYVDYTHNFDFFWIMGNIVFLIFLPRLLYAIKDVNGRQ